MIIDFTNDILFDMVVFFYFFVTMMMKITVNDKLPHSNN